MSNNYNTILQTNNSDLQTILNTINELPEAGGSEPNLQDKTISPSTSAQTVKADSGYDGLDTVTVNAMPTATQATPSITVNASGLITATATQTAGYVTAGTKSATNQLDTQAAKTITPTTSSQTAVTSGKYTTGAITVGAIPSTYVKPSATKAATTYTPTTSNQTIAAGTYCSGAQTIKGDANLVAGNIKNGTSIFGVTGTYVGGGGSSGDTSMEDGIVTRTITSYTNDRVTSIGSCAFYFCTALTSANFPQATTIGSEAFRSCTSLTSVNFPQATTIGSSAFSNCTSLTSVNFPQVTTIGRGAFYYCANLISISFPQVTTIGDFAFISCTSLTSISFPQVTTISGNAFQYCTSLTSISFPQLTSIGGGFAFGNCTSLSKIYLLKEGSPCGLANSNAFSKTGIWSNKGSIFVPASLVASYKIATNWAFFSYRIFSAP